jgi:hypothetical protein
MNYIKIYDSIIEKYRNELAVGYCEVHHIIPKCMGGSNEKDNLVALPYRYHFVAHLCLAKIYGGKLLGGAWIMSNCGENNSRKYAWLRKKVAEYSRQLNTGRKQTPEAKKKQIENQTGKKNGFYGKKHTQETKDKIIASHKGMKRKKHTEETKKKMSQSGKGRIFTEEHKLKISLSRKAKKMGSPMEGKKHTAESIAKMSKGHMGNIPWNKGMKKGVI